MFRWRKRAMVGLAVAIVFAIAWFYFLQFSDGRISLAGLLLLLTFLLFTYLLLVTLVFSVRPKVPQRQMVLSENVWRRIVEFAEDAILVIDPSGHVIYWNRSAENMFGHTKKEAEDMYLTEIIPPELRDQYMSGFAAFTRTGKTAGSGPTSKAIALRKNGDRFPVELTFTGIEIRTGVWGAMAAVRDKSVEESIKEDVELERTQKRELISIVAHQLKDPVAAIRWQTELLLEECEAHKESHEGLEIVNELAHKMNWLINDLLQSSRIESGRVRMMPEKINISDLTLTVVEELRDVRDENKRIRVSIDTGVYAHVDRDLFRQAELNIIENALKYSNDTQPVDVRVQKSGEHAMISVQDRGIGIREEDRPRIFTRFFRAENAMKRQVEGTGLGLFIAKQFVDRFDGEITFTSTPGAGTTFTIKLPLL